MRRLIFHPLAWLTDASLADSILGDLEELRGRRLRHSPLAASLWFWRSALGILAHVVALRCKEAMGSLFAAGAGGRGTAADVTDAVRGFRRRPVFAVSAILLLALGIGANTLVFSVVHSVVLRPLPYRDPQRLVYIWNGTDQRPGNRHPILTGTHVRDLAAHATSLESYAVAKAWDTSIDGIVDLVADEGSERLRGAFVTPNTFELLGVHARSGRLFTSADSDAAPVAVISGGLWKRRFGMDPRVVGKQIRFASGRTSRARPPYTIVGVLPEDVRFTYPRDTEVFLLLPWSEIAPSRALEFTMIGRLRPDVQAEQAEAEATTIVRSVVRGYVNISAKEMPALLDRTRAMVEPMQQHVAAEVRPGLLLLAGIAALVLVIACINLGLLMLARTIDRGSELAVRAALGAGPRRLLRLLAVEGLALTAMGGLAGVALATVALPLVRRLLPAIVPRADLITIDVPVLLFALLVTGTTTLVCGVVPGVVAIKCDLLGAIRRSGATVTATRGALAFRSGVVGVQVAIVLVLLVGAGLLLHSFWRLQHVDLGFDGDDVLTFETRLYNPKYRDRQRLSAFQSALLEEVRALPGVGRASITTAVPMRGVDFTYVVGPVNGKPRPGHMRSVDPDYFDVLKIPLRAGRLFTTSDNAAAPPVMIVSESYARQHFGDANPVGQLMELREGRATEIVGVVGDVRYAEVVRDPAPAFYVPRAQSPVELICLLVKPQPGMQALVAESLRTAVRSLDPEQPIEGLTTIGEIVSQSTADRRLYAFASGAFGAVALVLAMAGLFGVVSRSVAERRREFAIRAALGADSGRLARLVLRTGLIPVGIGAVCGLLIAIAGSRLLKGFLFEVQPVDAATYLASAGLMLLVAFLACLRPTIATTRLHPMAVLRD